ncbi:MAG: heparinase II/III-family protein [Treponema sp.]|nr:heparinase II/III-family protein [Treponema sp.]
MIKEIKLPQIPFRPFPLYTDRAKWTSLPSDIKNFYHTEAAKRKGQKWPALPASVYLEFYRDGNRSNYEKLYFDRRFDLQVLTIAECIEGRGEYLDDIINGIWLICEETTWVIPAHLNHGRPSKGSFYHRPQTGEKTAYPEPRRLHDPQDDVYIDLFSAETGSLVSWVYYFLGDAIAGPAPEVKRRMEEEVTRRILVPFAEADYFPWMGLSHDDPVNNWNPWINSNVLAAFLIFAPVFDRAEQGVNKSIKSINRFLHFYSDDGGCDEGPSYFGVAGASLLDFIEELGHVTDVSYLYSDKKIQNMVSYIYKVYIGNEYYVNYADAPPRVFVPVGVLERAGANMGNDMLASFSSYLRSNKFCNTDTVSDRAFEEYRLFAGIFSAGGGGKPGVSSQPGSGSQPTGFKAPSLAWFPGIQVVTARESEDSRQGLFFSAKGGNNSESHNHNDVGTFVLYCGGVPVLVDAGVETYTKFTFSDIRYTLWTMQSGYHNLPSINGADQAPGKEFAARDVKLAGVNGEAPDSVCPASGIRFSMDIAGAYPDSAGVKSYKRVYIFVPGTKVSGEKMSGDKAPGAGFLEVTDTWTLNECKSPLILNLLCFDRPVITGGKAQLGGRVNLDFDAKAFTAQAEEIKLADPKIHNDWQRDSLYRLRLVGKDMAAQGKTVLRFTVI